MIEGTGMIPSDEAVGGIRHKIPLQRSVPYSRCTDDLPRLGSVNEVADAVALFASCGYITGQSLLMYESIPPHLISQSRRVEVRV